MYAGLRIELVRRRRVFPVDDEEVYAQLVFNHRSFAGLHFTGSTSVFNEILVRTTANLQRGLYLSYPRICGETGGKDFHFAHTSANVRNFVNQTVRGAFEYQGTIAAPVLVTGTQVRTTPVRCCCVLGGRSEVQRLFALLHPVDVVARDRVGAEAGAGAAACRSAR
jgi:hypothetical protein